MASETDESFERRPCALCGAPAVRFDPYCFKAWVCDDHPAEYTVSTRSVELQGEFEAELAWERLWGPPEWLREWTEQQRARAG